MAGFHFGRGLKASFSYIVDTKYQSDMMIGFPGLSKRHWHESIVKAELRKVIDPKYNKSLGFTLEERQRLNVHGLFPHVHRTVEDQINATREIFFSRKSNLNRYIYMRSLRQRTERLYYRFISEHVEDVMPIIYTPTVGEVCQDFSKLFHNSMGLYITKYDKGHMVNVMRNWPSNDIRAVCVTDGERILGLGDLGAHGLGISVGKLDLYTALGKIPPEYLMPVVLDVGTENKRLLADPAYIGLREKRTRGAEYEEIVQEFMDSVVRCYGHQTLIHFEDFATVNAFKFINKYQNRYCYFNDDIQGTASTGLAGFLSAERITKIPLQDHVILFVGAGSAAVGICKLMFKEFTLNRKLSEKDAVKNIYLCDNFGLLTKNRDNLLPDVLPFVRDSAPITDLEELVDLIKPSIILGATGVGGIFTERILCAMGRNHKKPTIIACSNPTSKSECTAEQAYTFTGGRALFASGSPFPPVVINGKRIEPGQANNAFAFPGVALGVMCAKPQTIPDGLFLVTARAISDYVLYENPNSEHLYPHIKEAQKLAFNIGVKVAQYLIDNGMSTVFPKPCNVCEFVLAHQYYTEYRRTLPTVWSYPKLPYVPFPKYEPNKYLTKDDKEEEKEV